MSTPARTRGEAAAVSVPPEMPWIDALLSTEPTQRARLAQAGAAHLQLAAAVLALQVYAWAGQVASAWLWTWSAVTLLGMVVFWLLIRTGWSRRWREPSMTVAQIVFALSSSAVAYALLGAGRGAVLPVVLVVLMLGLFVATPRQMRWVSAYAVTLFGAVMLPLALYFPRAYPPSVELGHFMLLALMVPAVPLLASRLSNIRQRARAQRAELAQALARLREHSTRDELTGLINRRHMEVLMDQEHQRCIRSGQGFCLAVMDIDRFKPVNEAHGYAVGDAVLRAVAQEAQRHVRVSDTFCRWGGDDFVLMMSDARAALARGGLERLLHRVHALRILHGHTAVAVTVSGGLAEHRPGETVAQTLGRAERALQEAKALSSESIVVAP